MKSKFLYVQPKTEEALDDFEHLMYGLHSCRVKEEVNNRVLLSSITGIEISISFSRIRFWIISITLSFIISLFDSLYFYKLFR